MAKRTSETVESNENTTEIPQEVASEVSPMQETILVDETEGATEEGATEASPNVEHDNVLNAWAENKANEAELWQAVINGVITQDEYLEHTGDAFDPENKPEGDKTSEDKTSEADTKEAKGGLKAGIGHNLPPKDKDPIAEEVQERMTKWQPTSDSVDEAREQVKAVIGEALEYHTRGETSLRSRLAFTIADWTYFNTEGLAADGNKLVHVNRGMYQDILNRVSSEEFISKDDMSASVKSTLQIGIEGAILLMAGSLVPGYFVLPPDRKAVRRNDVAFAERPNEVPEGHKVLRALCIQDNVLTPRLPVMNKGSKVSEQPNPSTDLVLCPGYVQKSLYEALWDKSGELQYDALTGSITMFMSGDKVAAEAKAKAEKAAREQAKAKAELEAQEKAQAANTNAATPEGKPDEREPHGAVARQIETSMTTAREALRTIEGETGEKLREVFASLEVRVTALARENSALIMAQRGDLISQVQAIGALIRDPNQEFPVSAHIALFDDANSLVTRRITQSERPMSREEMVSALRLYRSLGAIIEDNENAVVIHKNPDGVALASYEGL